MANVNKKRQVLTVVLGLSEGFTAQRLSVGG